MSVKKKKQKKTNRDNYGVWCSVSGFKEGSKKAGINYSQPETALADDGRRGPSAEAW